MPALATASAGKPALDGRVSTVKRMIKIFRFRIEIYGAVETVQGGWRLVTASNASSAATQNSDSLESCRRSRPEADTGQCSLC